MMGAGGTGRDKSTIMLNLEEDSGDNDYITVTVTSGG